VSRISAYRILLQLARSQLITLRALQILYELTKSYSERGVGLHFVHLHPAHLTMFQFVGITDIVRPLPPPHLICGFKRADMDSMDRIIFIGI
jgi:hypothetical protein